jgi:hypothetical protein
MIGIIAEFKTVIRREIKKFPIELGSYIKKPKWRQKFIAILLLV